MVAMLKRMVTVLTSWFDGRNLFRLNVGLVVDEVCTSKRRRVDAAVTDADEDGLGLEVVK